MNQPLEDILKIVQHSDKLSADEKINISTLVEKAEEELAQKNRDLEIESSLEKVRVKTMAMQRSDELKDTTLVLFRQFKDLGTTTAQVSICVFDDEVKNGEMFVTLKGEKIDRSFIMELDKEVFVMKYAKEAFLDKQKDFSRTLTGKKLQEYNIWRNELMGMKKYDESDAVTGQSWNVTGVFFSRGLMGVSSESPVSEETKKILERFGGVFDLTYTRFLDLQKAEAQAREATIEASLERVRAKAMAMHNSGDLSVTASIVFSELRKLGIHPVRSGVGLLTKDSHKVLLYAATAPVEGGDALALVGTIDMSGNPCLKKQYEACLKKENYFPVLNGEELRSYYKELAAQISVPSLTEEQYRHNHYGYYFALSEGYFYAWTGDAYTEGEINILNRFKAIVDLTFRRYLDLQKAEAQTREAKIEAALERVRAKAMAMHKSDDLNAAVAVVFEELDKLNLGMLRCGIGIVNRENRCASVWSTVVGDQGRTVQVSGDESLDIHPLLKGAFEAWVLRGDFSYLLEGDDMTAYYKAVSATNFKLPESQSKIEHPKELRHYYYMCSFQAGSLFAFRTTDFPEEAKTVMKRFASVFNLTYKRFLDIQNAEALADKAQIEEQKLREEKKRSDSLLLNILPEEIANELKQFGKSYARKHEEVTILFADIKGFSSIAETLSADELVTELDECFRAFDKIIEKHGLEKIKTVGDAYICACGLPKPVPDNAAKTVAAALDMFEFIKGFGMTKKIQNLPVFEFRVGIHTGPVVTGVVGLKKFTYDIRGDAVNLAARMEQHGEVGKINISGHTYRLVKDKFVCMHRGKIEAKNKGEIDMYFVERAL